MKSRCFSIFKMLGVVLGIWTTGYTYSQTCGFIYSKPITIDHNKVSGTTVLNDFPVLINLTDTDLRTTANGGHVENTNGYDIYFLDASGERIAHQLEHYDGTTGDLVAWLRVPKLYPDANTELQMIYGNTAINSDPSTTDTWDNNYQAIWHLHDDLNDGTSYGNDGANSGSVDATGLIGDGQSFDGSNDYIYRSDGNLNGEIPSLSSGSPNQFTLSAWMYIDVVGSRRPVMSKQGNGSGTDRGFVFMMESDNRLKAELFKNNVSGDRTEVYSTGTLTTGAWYYVAMTYNYVTDGTSEVRLYINGTNDGSTNSSVGPIVNNSRDLDIGRYYWNGAAQYYQDGLLDEVRISNTVRSADWVATEYANQNSPSTFYSVGSETGGTYVPTIPTCGHSYRKVITVNNGQVSGSGSHTDFPVLISFTDSDLRTVANGGGVQNDNGYDIVFTDNNFIPLDYQIERYVPTTGEYHAWVRIPSLPTGSDYEINMMYGNPDIFADPSTYCTWSSDYEGVWHLDNSTSDGTSNGQDGIDNGTADIAGMIGRGRDFDGSDFIELTSFPNLTSDITISAWVRTTDNTAAGQRVFCDDELNSGGYALSIGDPGTGRPRFYSRSMNSVIVDGSNSINNNTWYYVTAVRDQTSQDRLIYVNGTLVGSDLTDTGTWGTDNGDASIGGETAAGETANRFEGRLDEVRVASTPRSVDWIITEYNNQNNPSGFYSVGSEISLNATTTGSGDWDQTGIWNTGSVPGDGAVVTILHNVDLDDRDITLCGLTVSTSNNSASRIRVQQGYTMTISEDVTMDESATNNSDATLRVMDNNSKMVIEGDLIIDQSNGDDVYIDVEDAGDSLIVEGNFLIEHDGGDNLDILVDNATAVMLVEGSVTANMNSGTDDIAEFDLNDGEFIVNGSFTGRRLSTFEDLEIDMDGGNFTADSVFLISSGGGGNDQILVMVDQTSVFTAGYLSMEMGGGDDHRLDVNANAGIAASLNISGDLEINKTGGDDLWIRANESSSVFHVGGDFNLTSTGAEELQFQVNSTASVDIDGDMTITHSAGQLNHIFLQGGGSNPTFNIDGDFTVNWDGGNDVFSLEMPGGTFSVGGNFTLNKDNNTGNVWYNLDDATLTVTDTLKALHNGDGEFFIELDGASTLNAGTFMGVLNGVSAAEELLIDLDDNSQMNVTGDIDLEMNTGNDLEFHLGQNTIGSTAQLTVGGNMTLDHNGAVGGDDIQFYLNDNTVAAITGIFTMETDGSSGGAGNFITRVWDDAVLSIGSNLVMDNTTGSGYLEIELDNNGKLELGGNVVRNSSPNNYGLIQSNSTTTTIEYNGSIAQVFADENGAGTDGIEYEQVVINNTFGTEPQLTMEAPVTLTNNITFTDGVLQSTAVNLLTIGDNATTNGGNANSYVSGPLRKEGDEAFIFPVGKDGNWARLGISDLQNGPTVTDQFTAEYFVARHPESFWDSNGYAGTTGGFYNVSIVEYWDLSRDAGTAEPKVTLYWESGTNSYIDDLTGLRVAHLSGVSTWSNEGGTTGGTVAAGSVTTTTNLSSFSPFTFGSLTPGSNPLPIELLTFDAQPSGNVVKLNWETLSEINNDYFTVERSQDGLNFEEVLRQQGAGSSNERLIYYAADDAPYKGVSYYRLKQTDYNGDYSYSGLVAVNFNGEQLNLLAFPNPVTIGSSIHLNRKVDGAVFDAMGKKVMDLKQQQHFQVVSIPGGIYFLKTVDGVTIKFIVNN